MKSKNTLKQKIEVEVDEHDQSLLLKNKMNDAIYTNIVPRLDVFSLFRLSQTCKKFYNDLAVEKQTIILNHRLAHFTVVEPNETEIKQILDKLYHNRLSGMLTKKIGQIEVVIDKENNIKRVLRDQTLLQLAYGDKDPEMCALYKSYFEKAFGDDAQNIMHAQIAEKFTKEPDFEEKDKQIKDHLAGLLNAVITVFTNEPSFYPLHSSNSHYRRDQKTGKIILSNNFAEAIRIFREEFAKTQPEVIDKGFHFREETLQEILDAYNTASWEHERCALFQDAILTAVLPYIPKNDQQRFMQGLHFLQDEDEKFSRPSETRKNPDWGGPYTFTKILSNPSMIFDYPHSGYDIVFSGQMNGTSGIDGWFEKNGQNVRITRSSTAFHQAELYKDLCECKNDKLSQLFPVLESKQRLAL